MFKIIILAVFLILAAPTVAGNFSHHQVQQFNQQAAERDFQRQQMDHNRRQILQQRQYENSRNYQPQSQPQVQNVVTYPSQRY